TRPEIVEVPTSTGSICGASKRRGGCANAGDASAATSDITGTRRRRPMTTRFICGITLLAAVILAPVPAVAQDAVTSSPPRSLIETFKQDLKSVVSKENASVLSAATAFALFAQPFDTNLTYSASCSTFLKTTFDPWARVAGQEWVLAGGAAATYVYGRVSGNSQLAAVGGDLIEAELIAGAGTHVLKYATQRPRPDGEEFSFPSGHAAGTFAMATRRLQMSPSAIPGGFAVTGSIQ